MGEGGGGGVGGRQGKTNYFTAACKRQLTGHFHVKLLRDVDYQLKRCLSRYISYTASSVMTTDYTGKPKAHTSWEHSCWDCRHAVHI